MISFFTDSYEDEILYSVIARYHYYIGNANYKETMIQLFGSSSLIPSLEFQSNLEYFTRQLNDRDRYNCSSLIERHTLYPLYSPFLPQDRKEAIEFDMRYRNGMAIYTKIGAVAGSICRKEGIYYCPKCAIEDKEKYGEAYFHRIHQVQGVIVCPFHGCLLYMYSVSKKDVSRQQFIRLEYEKANLIQNYEFDKKGQFKKIAQAAYFILNSNLKDYNRNLVHQKYIYLLKQKDLLTVNSRIMQKELYQMFVNYYDIKLLEKLESNVLYDNEFNWLKVITRTPGRAIHPIRHIMFILFLCQSVESFFSVENDIKRLKHKWPCLNPVSEHYKKLVIDNCKVTADYKTREPVGTFTCNICGFVYSRKMNSDDANSKYKIGRIKEFGSVWKEKLKVLVASNNYNINQLSIIMSCDPKTVVKYSAKIGLENLIDSEMKDDCNDSKCDKENKIINYIEAYRQSVLVYINLNPRCSKQQVRSNLYKEFSYLYRNDREWLQKKMNNLGSQKSHASNSRVDWESRDNEIVQEIKKILPELINTQNPARITKSSIGKKIGKLALLEHYIDKLPRSKRYLDEILETVHDFQVRRIQLICSKKFNLKKWQLIRQAGIRSKYLNDLEEIIEKCINKNQENSI